MERNRILVWDLPLRLFHWLLAASFFGAFVTAEAERYRDAHALLGYTVLALLAFRLVWAFAGTRYARLSSFTFAPSAAWRYLTSLLKGKPQRYVGHNPAGSWVVYALVLLGLVAGVSGHALQIRAGGHWVEELHEGASSAMLALVFVHIVGVVVSSFLHRENLVRAMLTGYKRGRAEEAIERRRRPTALLLVSALALLWSVLLQQPGAWTSDRAGTHRHEGQHERRGIQPHD
jgi:cytochrome b